MASFILVLMAQEVFAARVKPLERSDCEKMLLGRKGETARAVVGHWLANSDFPGFELLRVDISEDNLEEDHVYDEEQDDFVHTRYMPATPDQGAPLSNLELAALGIQPRERGIPTKDVRLSLKAKSAEEMVLTSYRGGDKIGETILSSRLLRIGFQNRVQFYQSYWKAEGYETDAETFFADSGQVLLPGGRFAFVFPLIATNNPPMMNKYFEIAIFSMRDCPGREALLMKDILFPEKGQASGTKNICLDPLGLKIIAPFVDGDSD